MAGAADYTSHHEEHGLGSNVDSEEIQSIRMRQRDGRQTSQALSGTQDTDKHDFASNTEASIPASHAPAIAPKETHHIAELRTPYGQSQPSSPTYPENPYESARSSGNYPRKTVSFPQPIESAPDGHTFRRNTTIGTVGTNYSESFEQTRPWDQKSILSLDGGGIRGYSALLIIKALMREIGKLERSEKAGDKDCDGPATSSFHPVNSSPTMATKRDTSPSPLGFRETNSDTSCWLPCHYFDYMAGTSTGGLISIMLGRLRMSIDDCISEYERLGADVFAHSRWFHIKSAFWSPREKYNHRSLERVIQKLVNDRVPKLGTFPGGKTFAFDENRCRVVVTSYQQSMDGENDHAELTYLFRTYKNLHQPATTDDKLISRNPGPAHDIPIWQVARATSAAPGYFKEVEIEGRRYLDGGFGANNPSSEIYEEVRRMNNHSNQCIKALISIGTGRSQERRLHSAESGLAKFLHFENFARKLASDSERVHEEMLRNPEVKDKTFKYYRFNVEEGLHNIKLDDWRARGPLRLCTGRCIGKLRRKRGASSEHPSSSSTSSLKEKSSPNTMHTDRSHQSSPSLNSETPITNSGDSSDSSDSTIPGPFQPRNRTLDTLRENTEAYISTEDMQTWLKECARLLVDSRRDRAKADPQRWERACFGAWYQCIEDKCPRGEKEYHTRRAIEKHFLHKHGNVHTNLDELSRRKLEAALDKCKVVVH